MYMLKHFRSCISAGVEQLCLLAELLQTRLRVGKNGEKNTNVRSFRRSISQTVRDMSEVTNLLLYIYKNSH